MNDKVMVIDVADIKSKIFTIRGMQVMLDSDLAELYGVETRILNQSVKRNSKRFPYEFMFQLTREEFNSLISQIVISNESRGGRRKLPYVFTEQGVSMLSAILKSDVAIDISIKIINAFVSMRRFLAENAKVFQKLDQIEIKQLKYQNETDDKFEKVFNALQNKDITPKHGIFFNGQVFDAHVFVSGLIKKAKSSIVLIDNYIDETVLVLLSKRKKNCSATIYTKNISKQLQLDLKKYNEQYPVIEIKILKNSHDRFMILDDKTVYHIGASLKDLGKKWFAFSKFDTSALMIMERLKDCDK
jgi:hypothetical protein